MATGGHVQRKSSNRKMDLRSQIGGTKDVQGKHVRRQFLQPGSGQRNGFATHIFGFDRCERLGLFMDTKLSGEPSRLKEMMTELVGKNAMNESTATFQSGNADTEQD